jgi:phage gp36-like protein
MPYVVITDLPADIPPDFLTQALDDDGDGVQDAGLFDLIAQQVSDAIDAQIGVRYDVPVPVDIETGNYPAIILNAARTLAAEKLYARRGTTDVRNPWTSRANAIRSQLELIGKGRLPLDPADARKNPSASVNSAPMQTVSCNGRMSL